jgi:predicted lipid carrier protein YhbT
MTTTAKSLPAPLGKLLGRLPAFPGSLLFVSGLNLTLAKHLNDDVTQVLRGKKMRLHVIDTQWKFDFVWRNGRFIACSPQQRTDLCLSASAYDFLQLARRQEDPDTLFFNRRLTMEGDTELGLLVKNTMDAMELPVFDPKQFHPVHVLGNARAKFSAQLAAFRQRS